MHRLAPLLPLLLAATPARVTARFDWPIGPVTAHIVWRHTHTVDGTLEEDRTIDAIAVYDVAARGAHLAIAHRSVVTGEGRSAIHAGWPQRRPLLAWPSFEIARGRFVAVDDRELDGAEDVAIDWDALVGRWVGRAWSRAPERTRERQRIEPLGVDADVDVEARVEPGASCASPEAPPTCVRFVWRRTLAPDATVDAAAWLGEPAHKVALVDVVDGVADPDHWRLVHVRRERRLAAAGPTHARVDTDVWTRQFQFGVSP